MLWKHFRLQFVISHEIHFSDTKEQFDAFIKKLDEKQAKDVRHNSIFW